MSIFKIVKAIAKVGEKIVDVFENVVDFADHIIHKKEYERKAKRRKTFWTVMLSVAGGLLVVLLFPYRIIIKKNGDFMISNLLFRVKTSTFDLPEADDDCSDFDIAGVDDYDYEEDEIEG